MKFILFVEGDTEQRVLPAFLKRWLDPLRAKCPRFREMLEDMIILAEKAGLTRVGTP